MNGVSAVFRWRWMRCVIHVGARTCRNTVQFMDYFVYTPMYIETFLYF